MLSFLLWNLNRKDLQDKIADIAYLYELDIILLLECKIEPAVLLKSLNGKNNNKYRYIPPLGCEKITIFASFPPEFIPPINEKHNLTVRHLKLPGLTDIILACVHLPSKLHWGDDSQALECTAVVSEITSAEKKMGHNRTIVAGDFNMNPFEVGVVGAHGFHAIASRDIAQRGHRTVQSRQYRYFYNPMWNLFGDETPGPPGTYYYNAAQPKTYFWNMFDQVLIRPDLLPFYDSDKLEIINDDGCTSLLTAKGLPDNQNSSDHLPIHFGLNL